MTTMCYRNLAEEYDAVLGRIAERTWQHGVLVEAVASGAAAGVGGLVVDLGAGTGIGGRLLGRVGIGADRIGIDRSAPMLRQATGAYEYTVLGDIVDPPLRPGTAALVVSGFDTVNYLDPQALGWCLRGVSRCLRPDGRLIFDYSSPVLVRRRFGRVEHLPDGCVRMWHEYQPDRDRSVSVVERCDRAESVRWRETHIHYAVSADQLHRLAAAAGLRVERVRNLNGSEFSPRANTHVWVLRKPA